MAIMLTKIVCRATDCIFNEGKLCTSEEIVYDPEEGCLTYEILDDLVDEVDDELEDEILTDDDDLEWDEDDDIFLEDEDDLEDEDEEDEDLEALAFDTEERDANTWR